MPINGEIAKSITYFISEMFPSLLPPCQAICSGRCDLGINQLTNCRDCYSAQYELLRRANLVASARNAKLGCGVRDWDVSLATNTNSSTAIAVIKYRNEPDSEVATIHKGKIDQKIAG